jgi:hypothetical protein
MLTAEYAEDAEVCCFRSSIGALSAARKVICIFLEIRGEQLQSLA